MASSDADDSDDEVPDHLVTAPVMLRTGLLLMGFTEARIRRAKDETNQERFLNHVGVAASTACAICEDMQLTTIADARIKGSELNLKWFLLGLYYIRKYPKASDLESKFDYSKYLQKCRFMTSRKIFGSKLASSLADTFYRHRWNRYIQVSFPSGLSA